MNEAKKLLTEISKGDISENEQNLLTGGIIDSLDVMELVELISKKFGEVNASDINSSDFESISAINSLINRIKAKND
ncbi:acyl carrier protein [Campylobacter concisus]|jgi:putative acyl carrier protein|uniref:acyl carrier protein n=1 Tax=Campylobacter concisus TaxID=199 RepID=UPI000CD8D0D5|nr:acyl carrier protein [Campylobacter concisus]MDU2360712.1 acyl carrier protein [Campylobacter concisus]